jgi:hypothetical protein
MDAREKQRALEPFAPDALNLSPPSLRGQRRPFNEAVLDYGHEPHRLAERFLAIVREEVTTMLSTDGVLDYDRALAAFRRINRRCVLGDAAADDTALSDEHSRLREDGNWLGLKVWNRGRDARLRASMDQRIRGYVDAAEPGTLVSLFPSAPQAPETNPNGQVPFCSWRSMPSGSSSRTRWRCLRSNPRRGQRLLRRLTRPIGPTVAARSPHLPS